MQEQIWYLKQCSLFEQISRRDVARIEGGAKAKSFGRGEPIYLPADEANSVFLLASGRAKICHLTPDGKQSTLAFIEPGELFGELAIVGVSEQREEYAEALEDSVVVMIQAQAVQELLERYPSLSLGITKLFGLRRRRVEQRLKDLLFMSNRERLTALLLELADRYGGPSESGVELAIQLTHQEIANVIGSTRETVTVALGELQNAGLISLGRRRIVITNPGELARLARKASSTVATTRAGQHIS